MLVTANWVLPIAAPPIEHGGVLIDGDRIVAVDVAEKLASHPLAADRRDFDDCIMTPGLVNAHTHLTLSALHGVVPSLPFIEWLPRLVAAMKPWEIADHEASGVVGAEECLLSGVTVVGDIAYGAAEVASASKTGLGGVYYWELLGIQAEDVDGVLADLRYPTDRLQYGPRVTCGLSPHAPYSCGPGLLRAVQEKALALRVPTAIHVAESSAELQLLCDGTGPLASVAQRNAPDFEPPHTSTPVYLDGLGTLSQTTVVHLCHLESSDVGLLADKVRGAVTCPRSNRYLHNPRPRVAELLDAGVAVGVGTDSSASNFDLDLMEEVRAVRDAEPELSSSDLMRLATLGGAMAIGVERDFGSLEAGKFADLSLFALDFQDDPEASLVQDGGAKTLAAVMSGGQWRVLGGELLLSDSGASSRAQSARAISVAQLKGAPLSERP